MEFSKQDMKILKGVAIIFMLSLHLFCRKEVNGLYETFPEINGVPLIYYIALFCDACVPIYCFASGYGLFISTKGQKASKGKNYYRIFKLVMNFWVIFALFIPLGIILGHGAIHGNPSNLLLNFFLLSSSFNGAWWFLQTYVILVLLNPWIFKLVHKYNFFSILFVSGIIYYVSYVQRIKHIIDLSNHSLLNIFVTAIVLFGTSQLPFIAGAVFAKYKIYTKIYNIFFNIRFKNTLCFMGILFIIILHSFVQTMFIAPLTGIIFICIFNLIDKGQLVQRLLNFFGNHSTNIWLTHMFFYMTLFPALTFAPKYPILILGWLLLLCLTTSYVINFVYRPIIKQVDRKMKSIKENEKGLNEPRFQKSV